MPRSAGRDGSPPCYRPADQPIRFPRLASGSRSSLGDDVYLQAALFSGDPAEFDGSNQPQTLPTGTIFSFRGGAWLIAEAGYTPNQQKGAVGLPGNYKLGYWYHTSRHFGDQRFDNTGLSLADPVSTGIPFEHTGNWGIYGVVDQMLYRVPGTDDQGLLAFFRIGGSPSDRNLISFYFDGGVVYKGTHPRTTGRQDRTGRRLCAHRQQCTRPRS